MNRKLAMLTVSALCLIQMMAMPSNSAFAQCESELTNRTILNPEPDRNDIAFGARIAASGNLVVVGSGNEHPQGTGPYAGKAYVYDATTGASVATLTDPASAGDFFGYALSISGNLGVVGATSYDNGGSTWAPGRAYVFNATTGAVIATLASPAPKDDETFGFSAGISGNLTAVGSPASFPMSGATDSGAAYVFDATTGNLQATLDRPYPEYEGFAESIAISGNLVVVGAPRYSPPDPSSIQGRAHIYNATTGDLIWTLDHPNPSGDTELDNFGQSVAISGNLVLIGARDGADGAAAYVFDAATGTLVTTLSYPAPKLGGGFAHAVALSGQMALVGAYADRRGGVSNTGAAFLFDATTGTLLGTLHNPNVWHGWFGYSVAVSEDFAAVGAKYAPGWGNAHIFTLEHDSHFAENTIPSQLPQNHSWPITITVCNTGTFDWSESQGVALTVISDTCGNSSGTQITLDPSVVVSPSASHVFSTTLASANSLGPCNLQFQMTHNGIPFGEILSVSPEVVGAVNNADLLSNTFPSTMAPGQSLSFDLTFKNTGNTAWLPNSPHALGVLTSDSCNLFSQTRFQPTEPVLPNENFLASVFITPPAAPAKCSFTLRMLEEGVEWFGEPFTHTITIAEPPNSSRNWAIYQ